MRLLHLRRIALSSALVWIVAGPLAAATVEGRVSTSKGTPVGHARVVDVHAERAVSTDDHGVFTLDCELPCLLVVRHPRFEELAQEVRELGEGKLELVLQAKQEVFAEIVVTADRGVGDSLAPASIASTVVKVEDKAIAPTTLTELVEGVPGVAENGQGGLFQVFSIRGVSRYRVLTLVDGMPIVHERRAGAATSFLDPLLLGGVDVLRGPASTHYGSGALGGVVQVFPRRFEGLSVETGWSSWSDETYQAVGWGEDGWSVGLARRAASDDQIADGTLQNSHFTQGSAVVSKRWQAGDKTYDVLALGGLGRDLGKPNSDFPDDRVTNYPQETHAIFKFSVLDDSGWTFHAAAHPNNLVTETLRPGSRLSEVRNEAFDLSTGWSRPFAAGSAGGRVEGRVGVDYFARRDVLAFERDTSLGDGSVTEARTLDSGEQDEIAAYASARWGWGAATLQAGGRFTWIEQRNLGAESRDDSAATGFLGLVLPLGKGFELVANAGTGFRFPNLGERFFTGTTARGEIISNPDLEAETSINLDAGLRWYGDRLFFSAQVFRMEVDDYIERIEVVDDVQTFVNLLSGTIEGLEIEGFYEFDDVWRLHWSGHLLDGESRDGAPLADVPADRVQFGLSFDQDRWKGRLDYQIRDAKTDPGSGEMSIGSAQVVSAAVSYEVREGLRLQVRGENLLDEIYFNSADDKAVVSPGRAIGIGLSWGR